MVFGVSGGVDLGWDEIFEFFVIIPIIVCLQLAPTILPLILCNFVQGIDW